eukprot:361747-Chlamydomonas_euryale.AAC.14
MCHHCFPPRHLSPTPPLTTHLSTCATPGRRPFGATARRPFGRGGGPRGRVCAAAAVPAKECARSRPRVRAQLRARPSAGSVAV